MPLLYDIGTALYHLGIRAAAPFVPKARQWVDGRRAIWRRLEAKSAALQGCLWMHCASVGEFEQGRPVLEAIKAERPDLPVLLTFFSPSGYEARRDLALATHVEYLPPDGVVNAERLLRLIEPRAALFIKYEFWYHHLMALSRAGVPTFLVSAIFRPEQTFFRWFGGTHRAMLRSDSTPAVGRGGWTRSQENATTAFAEGAPALRPEGPELVSPGPHLTTLGTQFLGGLLDQVRNHIGDHDLHALGRELLGHRATDALSPARDHRDLADNVLHADPHEPGAR